MILWLWACSAPAPEAVDPTPQPEVVAPPPNPGPFGLIPGAWSAWFVTDGGPARFELEILPGDTCRALVSVGGHAASEPRVVCDAGVLSARFSPWPASLSATIGPDGRTLRGHWSAGAGQGADPGLPFEATWGPVPAEAWLDLPTPTELSLAGPAGQGLRLNLRNDGLKVLGALADRDGDSGPLAGGWTPEGLEMSGFDGEMPVLLRIAPDEAGRMAGHLWRGSAPPVELVEQDAPVALDGWDRVPTAALDLRGLTLPRVGTELTEALPSQGPRIVHVVRSACRGCNDSAATIERIAREVPGTRVVLLGWEPGLEPARAERELTAFRARHALSVPMWRVDRAPAFLPEPTVWPVTLFVRADGSVAASHVGFHGPATGALHDALVAEMLTQARSLSVPMTPP